MNLVHLKIAIRNLLKNKTESIIGILGLGIGLGSIMLLLILVIHEYSFDRFIPEYSNVYRVIQGDDCRTPYLLAEETGNDIPEIKLFFRFHQTNNFFIKDQNNQVLTGERFGFSEPTIFSMLGIGFKYGIPARSAGEVAISYNMAKKYFKNDVAIGKILTVKFNDNFFGLTVSGVYNDFPSNSTLDPEFIAHTDLSGEVFGQTRQMLGAYGTSQDDYKNWRLNYFYTYFLLNRDSDRQPVTEKLQVYTEMLDQERWKDADYKLQPVTEIYFNTEGYSGNQFSRFGNADELKYYVAIAIVILLIAVMNYVLLTRAKILNRLNELGVKKSMGATQNAIRKQVVFEASLVSLLSLIPAFLIIIPGMPFINSVLNKSLGSGVFAFWQTWLALFFIVCITGVFSGFIIGNHVSGTSVVGLLAGMVKRHPTKYKFSNSFLTFHFAVFMILVVSVITFQKQIRYALTSYTSINPEKILVCDLNTPELQAQISVIKNELLKNPGILSVAGSSFVPPFNLFLPINLKTEEATVRFDGLILGEGMIELLEMEIIDGEPFGPFDNGRTNLVINESAALEYGIKAGELLNGFLVKGIVKDFNAHSMHSLIQPMAILQQHPEKMRILAVKTNGVNDAAVIRDINRIFKNTSPEAFVNINYLTDNINQFYEREQNQARIIGVFSLLAIVLSVMGLFGMVLITIAKRTKEIGLRKVNGAGMVEVIIMLNKGFLIWIIISFIISVPLSYFAMDKWLENFAYKTDISWWIFIVAGILALAIALLTVTFHTWKAATRNPVEALRYE